MSFVIHQQKGYTWDHMKEEIKKYALKDDLQVIKEYLTAVDEVLK
jgi:hypothetical protein